MKTRREETHLWLAISISLTLAAYRITVGLVDSSWPGQPLFAPTPLMDWLTNALFFWLLALLLIAYFKWTASIRHEHSMEEIFSSVRTVAMLVVRPDRTVTFSNAAAGTFFGWEAAQMLGKKTELFYDDRRLDGKVRHVSAALKETNFHVGEAVGRRRNGDPFPLEIVTALLSSGNGAVLVLRDLTDTKKANAALSEAKNRAELINRITPSAVFTVDTAGLITSWNQRAEEITGFSSKEIINKPCTLFAETPCKDKCGLFAVDVAKPVLHRECTIVTKDGQRRVVLKNVDCIRDEEGRITGGIESFEDITERKGAEQEMQNMNALMMGREERILELKREVNELRAKAGLPLEYDLT